MIESVYIQLKPHNRIRREYTSSIEYLRRLHRPLIDALMGGVYIAFVKSGDFIL